MAQFEYKVVAAPRRGEKAKGVKTTPDRFAYALGRLMNQMAAEGWEYLRADTLPCDERVGLTGKATTFQSLLVFRRAVAEAVAPAVEVTLPRVAPPPPAPAEPAIEALAGDRPGPDLVKADAPLPKSDPLDDAARRAVAAPPVARPIFGRAPNLTLRSSEGPAPPVGPARGDSDPGKGPRGSGQAAE